MNGRLFEKVGQMKATARNHVARAKTKTSAPKRKRKLGAAKMREAADKVVSRDCEAIAEALSTNGKNGQSKSAEFLYELARFNEQSQKDGEGARTFRSMAMELANSPEWKGDWPKAQDDEGEVVDDDL